MTSRKKIVRNLTDGTIKLPSKRDWRTTDEDEINRRRLRAIEEKFVIRNKNGLGKIYSDFSIRSGSGMQYDIELRDLKNEHWHCTCTDFLHNGLNTCKHIEALLLYLESRFPRLYIQAREKGSHFVDIVPSDSGTLAIERNFRYCPPSVRQLFTPEGVLKKEHGIEDACRIIESSRSKKIRISRQVHHSIENNRRAQEKIILRREYEQRVHEGIFPQNETNVPLYPYQRDGMLHLAFTGRALLADEMGLGKTIQAIAACALLKRIGKASRVLIVAPASLKGEWEEQIGVFTDIDKIVVFGGKRQRLRYYVSPAFFTIVNYEQVRSDALDINALLKPDIVVLDEAQRIKNWNTSTAQAVKRLDSQYAFVLTGTPVENRIDELYSIVDFLDPTVFGSLFRFNRLFYDLDHRGRPAEYRNLELLHTKIAPLMLRRRKADVESELPGRTDRNFFVSMSSEQRDVYREHEMQVAQLVARAKKRPLRKAEQDKLMRELAMMRMVCDTVSILDPECTQCPKLAELGKIFDEVLSEPDVKIVIFSEWVRMLELIRTLCEKRKIGYAWHTGQVPQKRRRAEIRVFKNDPSCRVFICSESGGVGLNLQNASVVINCDLPWNPAKLEQRIARVWRKKQTRAVTVVNLISENTLEHKMLYTLAAKQELADGVLDRLVDFNSIRMRGGAQAFFKRLEQVMSTTVPAPGKKPPSIPVDRPAHFARQVSEKLGAKIVACEERYPIEGEHSVVLVVVEDTARDDASVARALFDEIFDNNAVGAENVEMEVIDRSLYESIERLERLGLVKSTIRTSRQLYPVPEARQEFTEEQRKEIEDLINLLSRKIKLIQLLHTQGFTEELRQPLTDAVLLYGKKTAIENGFPAPSDVNELIRQPYSKLFDGGYGTVKNFIQSPDGAREQMRAFVESIRLASP
jgi:hypothetical protein